MKKRNTKSKLTKPKKTIPVFNSEVEERKFWQTHDSTEYIDWHLAKKSSFPNLKPSTKVISLRLPESLLADIKSMANKMDIPYQSLMKVFLSEKVNESVNARSSLKAPKNKRLTKEKPGKLVKRG